MNRRSAIRNLALATVGTLLWTGCEEQYVNVLSLYKDGKMHLDEKHLTYLNKISDTFLPLRELAADIERPADFITRMINELQSPEDIFSFAEGFEAYKSFMSAAQLKIDSSNPKVVLGLVKEIIAETPPLDNLLGFVNAVRGYSVWNLKTSDHYMTEYQEYAMVPPPFNGNAPV